MQQIDLIHSDDQRKLIFKQLLLFLTEELQLMLGMSEPPDQGVIALNLNDLALEYIAKLAITPEPLVTVYYSGEDMRLAMSCPKPRAH